MIEGFQPTDMKEIMRLWRTGNQAAHDFIAQAYWEGHEKQVEEMMPLSELYVYRKEAEIKGFIGISEASYIAGLFVDAAAQNMGIGSALLSYCKRRYLALSLHVYEKNKKAIAFYEKNGFQIVNKTVQEETGEMEYEMRWKENLV